MVNQIGAIVFFRSSYETGCRILHSLEFSEKMVTNVVECVISIVETLHTQHVCSFPVYKQSRSQRGQGPLSQNIWRVGNRGPINGC